MTDPITTREELEAAVEAYADAKAAPGLAAEPSEWEMARILAAWDAKDAEIAALRGLPFAELPEILEKEARHNAIFGSMYVDTATRIGAALKSRDEQFDLVLGALRKKVADIDRLVALLKRCEWREVGVDSEGTQHFVCPVCGRKKEQGHAENCDLAREIEGM